MQITYNYYGGGQKVLDKLSKGVNIKKLQEAFPKLSAAGVSAKLRGVLRGSSG
jgi:hypothetical protein